MTTAYRISCAKCKQIVESLETALCSGLTTILGVTSQWRAREIVCWKSELSLHAIILSWLVYYVESELWCHITQKNQKIVRTPHILGRLNTSSPEDIVRELEPKIRFPTCMKNIRQVLGSCGYKFVGCVSLISGVCEKWRSAWYTLFAHDTSGVFICIM